jgi:hypothetical protein
MAEKIKITGNVMKKHQATSRIRDSHYYKLKSAKVVAGYHKSKGDLILIFPRHIYTIKIEFISFKSILIKERTIDKSLSLGTIALIEDATQLNSVVIRAENLLI